jgi:hypothetical protein
LRMCYLKNEATLLQGVDRFSSWLKTGRVI